MYFPPHNLFLMNFRNFSLNTLLNHQSLNGSSSFFTGLAEDIFSFSQSQTFSFNALEFGI